MYLYCSNGILYPMFNSRYTGIQRRTDIISALSPSAQYTIELPNSRFCYAHQGTSFISLQYNIYTHQGTSFISLQYNIFTHQWTSFISLQYNIYTHQGTSLISLQYNIYTSRHFLHLSTIQYLYTSRHFLHLPPNYNTKIIRWNFLLVLLVNINYNVSAFINASGDKNGLGLFLIKNQIIS